MKPYFWINMYTTGIILCLVFMRYAKEAQSNQDNAEVIEISRSTRFMIAIEMNTKLRYAGYLISIGLAVFAFAWTYPYFSDSANQSRVSCALFATFANVLIALSFTLFLMPALAGKAAMFSEIFGCGMFLSLSNLCAFSSALGPVVCLWFFLSTGSPLIFQFYVQSYYWESNCFFTLVFALILAMLTEKPIYSLIQLGKDREDAFREDNKNSILNLKHQRLSALLYESVIEKDKDKDKNGSRLEPSTQSTSAVSPLRIIDDEN